MEEVLDEFDWFKVEAFDFACPLLDRLLGVLSRFVIDFDELLGVRSRFVFDFDELLGVLSRFVDDFDELELEEGDLDRFELVCVLGEALLSTFLPGAGLAFCRLCTFGEL